jgi:ubiquinone/menaquinone biosynthesis C-methylase UbiE
MNEKCNYTKQAENWKRNTPISLSDFVARPFLFSEIKNILKNKDVLDAGCGEGYFARKIAYKCKSITAMDLSKGMIKVAIEQETETPLGIKYYLGNVLNLKQIPDDSIDVYISSMVAHYLLPKDLNQFYKEINRVLKKNGQFFILLCHPNLIDLYKDGSKKAIKLKNKIIDLKNYDQKGLYYEIIMKTITNKSLIVGFVNYDLEDHKYSIINNNLKLNYIKEITVPKIISLEAPIYSDLIGDKMYMFFKGKKI